MTHSDYGEIVEYMQQYNVRMYVCAVYITVELVNN